MCVYVYKHIKPNGVDQRVRRKTLFIPCIVTSGLFTSHLMDHSARVIFHFNLLMMCIFLDHKIDPFGREIEKEECRYERISVKRFNDEN